MEWAGLMGLGIRIEEPGAWPHRVCSKWVWLTVICIEVHSLTGAGLRRRGVACRKAGGREVGLLRVGVANQEWAEPWLCRTNGRKRAEGGVAIGWWAWSTHWGGANDGRCLSEWGRGQAAWEPRWGRGLPVKWAGPKEVGAQWGWSKSFRGWSLTAKGVGPEPWGRGHTAVGL